MDALLSRSDPPTGVVTINDMYAFGACASLHEAGIGAPRISVIGFDDIVLAPLYNPPLTTVRQPLQRMAEYAIRAIQEGRSPGGAELPRSVLMQPTLIERQSTAAPVRLPRLQPTSLDTERKHTR